MIQAKSTLIFILILVLCHVGLCADQKPLSTTIDSLKKQLELSENYDRYWILLELSEEIRMDDPDQSESYMLQAKEYINEETADLKLFFYYKNFAGVKLSQNHYEEALELSEKALMIEFDNKNAKDNIHIYEFIATAYQFLGENVKAHEALFSGLRLSDSLNIDTVKVSLYNTIGIIYNSMTDFIMAEKYFLLAIDLAKKFNQKSLSILAKGNLAMLYTNQERYDESIDLNLEVIELVNKTAEKRNLGVFYNNLANNYTQQHKFKKALSYLYKALKIGIEKKRNYSVAVRSLNISAAYLELENYDLAKENLDRATKIAEELKNKELYIHGLYYSFEYYERIGNYKEALNYHKEYTIQNDSLLNESRIKAVAEFEEKYESEKKEKEILALSQDKATAEKRERTLIYIVLILSLGLLAFGSVFYYLRQNQIKNSIIQKKNLKIASDKIQLLEKGKEIIALESLITGQESERGRLAKEMHDGLGGLLAISHSKLANLCRSEIEVNPALNEAFDLVGDAYNQVRQISHNLMPLGLEKFGLVAALTNLIQSVNQQNEISVDFRTYNFDLFLNNELGLNIYRISQEALANVLKSAKAKTVLIELIQHKDMISLSIEDDGIGFNLDDNTSGIGIRSMRDRTELLNGKFSIESKISIGTSIFVLFPNHSNKLMPSQA